MNEAFGPQKEGEERQEHEWPLQLCQLAAVPQAGSSTGAVPAIIQHRSGFGETSGGLLLDSSWWHKECWLGNSKAEGGIRWGFGIKATPVSSSCLSITWQWNVSAGETKQNMPVVLPAVLFPLVWEGCTMYWPWLKKSSCFWGCCSHMTLNHWQTWTAVCL